MNEERRRGGGVNNFEHIKLTRKKYNMRAQITFLVNIKYLVY